MEFPMYVDFSITPYCNLNCKFCYAEAESEIITQNKESGLLTLQDFNKIFQEFDEMGVMRVGFEGGEPFLRKDWYEIFKLADEHCFNYFINTNATLIDSDVAKKIKDIEVDKICVSLDGSNARVHDLSRGKDGTFELTVKGIKNLLKENILVDGIITLTKYNKDDIINILYFMKDLGISNVAIMLLATVGNADKFKSECYLTYQEQKKVILELNKLKKENGLPISVTIIPVGEGKVPWELYLPFKEENILQDLGLWISDEFDTLGVKSVGCTAGKDNFYVNGYGDVYGCSMMCVNEKMKAGNLKNNNLNDIWSNSNVFQMLRRLTMDDLTGKCSSCEILDICQGGCRACACTADGNINASDNRCPIERRT